MNVVTLKGAFDSRWIKISKLFGKIRRIVENVVISKPDIVVLEGASWVLYHWLLIRRLQSKLPQVQVIYHSHNVEYLLRKEKHGRLVTNITRWAEGRVLRKADISFAVSEVDSQQFYELYGIKTKYLPNGVDLEKFDQVIDTDIQTLKSQYNLDENTILFMGSYLYKPNRYGINFLINLVMPILFQHWDDVKLVVTGGKVPYNEPWLINPGNIPYEQLPAFIKTCAIGVAPIFSGSGTRLKVLEYMAAGKPVVATSKGAEGLNVQNGRDILIANEAEVFAADIDRLLSDRQLSASLGKCGRKVVNAHYSWKTIMKHFNNALKT